MTTVPSCHPNTTQLAHQHKLHKRSSSTGTTVKFITQYITLNPGSNSTDRHTPATAHHCNCCTAAARASSLVVHAFALQYITVQYRYRGTQPLLHTGQDTTPFLHAAQALPGIILYNTTQKQTQHTKTTPPPLTPQSVLQFKTAICAGAVPPATGLCTSPPA